MQIECGTNEYKHATVHSVCAYIKKRERKEDVQSKSSYMKDLNLKRMKKNGYDEYKARIFGGMLSIERYDDDIGGGG